MASKSRVPADTQEIPTGTVAPVSHNHVVAGSYGGLHIKRDGEIGRARSEDRSGIADTGGAGRQPAATGEIEGAPHLACRESHCAVDRSRGTASVTVAGVALAL